MPKQTKTNHSSWQTELLRLTLFPSPAAQIVTPTWWSDLVGKAPDSSISHPTEGEQREEGQFKDTKLVLHIQPTRIDWWFGHTGLDQGDWEVGDFLMNAPFQDALEVFSNLMLRWFELETCPAAQRLAFGAILHKPVENHQEGYQQLSNLLPFELDPNGSIDFLYQINRPRPSNSEIEGLIINRLSKWAVENKRRTRLSLGNKATEIVVDASIACRLELDINSAPDFQHELRGGLAQLFREFIELGQEISEKGDIP